MFYGSWKLIGSDVIEYEIIKTPDIIKRNKKSPPQSRGVFFFVEEIFCTCGVYYHEF
jgi:hypothetical protein